MAEEKINYDEVFYRRGNPHPGCCWFNGEDGLDLALAWEGNDSKNISIIETTEIEKKIYFKQNVIGYGLSNEGFNYFEENKRIEVYTEQDLLEFIDEYGPLRNAI